MVFLPQRIITPKRDGAELNAEEISRFIVGMAVAALGGESASSDSIAIGFNRLASIGTQVDAKTPIARMHARDDTSAAEAARRLVEAYQTGIQPDTGPVTLDRIMPGEF